MLEGVVANGSGKALNITAFKVGGKTGTAQIAKIGVKRVKGKSVYGDVGDRNYQASFVGYFPADNPLYTCIVVINSPSNGVYYGAAVAGPVFKEIAEKVYSSSLNCITPINNKSTLITNAPDVITARSNELAYAAKALSIPVQTKDSEKFVHRDKRDSTRWSFSEINPEAQLKKELCQIFQDCRPKTLCFCWRTMV